MKTINKIKLQNFKRFYSFEIKFNESINLLIGDNEAGKSSILLALDLVLSGSRSKIETIGLENLFNVDVITNFLSTDKKYNNLPVLYIELYLSEQNNPDLNGKNNSKDELCDGLRLTIKPNDELSKEITEILEQDSFSFPFEYYSINFKTFSDQTYSGYKKFIRHLLIDSSKINNEYATREYISTIYNTSIINSEKNKHQNEYRNHKKIFKDNVLKEINQRQKDYYFAIETSSKSNFETDLTIEENGISIENKGKGRQCFIKTEFALQRKNTEKDLDILLLEEPENHLSHINMKKLIRRISDSENKQIFIATHSNLVSSRLDLRKSILLNSNSKFPVSLNQLTESTAKFFMKAPDNNILEFILSKKVILVEGDAEFILMDAIYSNITQEKLEDSDIHVISVDGTSFKRYLELAKLLNLKTVVIRDNDKNYQHNCVDNYSEYVFENIKIFSDKDNTRHTFEICIYQDNKSICDDLFEKGRRTLTVQEYMIDKKADVAFELLDKKANELVPPEYIKEAILWIKE